MLGADVPLVCEMLTRRVGLAQLSTSRAIPVESTKRASLPPGKGR
jgi:hypothetical protein